MSDKNENDLLIMQSAEELVHNVPTNTSSPQEQREKVVDMSSSIEAYTDRAISKVQQSMVEHGTEQDFREGSKNIAHMVATAEALDNRNDENEDFLRKIKHEKQEEIKESFKGERYKEQARTIESKRKKAEEFYNSFRPILEFDFSPLIPKNSKTILFRKRPKKDKKGNIITESYEPAVQTREPSKEVYRPTYEDRSYGIPLMCLMLALLTVPYCVITVLLSIFNGINAVFDGIARFGKPALIICGSVVGIALMILFVYFVLLGIDTLFGTAIVSAML